MIICTGQDPLRVLACGLEKPYYLMGGASVTTELDTKRAIHQGAVLALAI